MNVHQSIGSNIGHCGKQVMLNGKHLADCANPETAAWIAEALVLQSTQWNAGERARANARWMLLGALLIGLTLGICAAAMIEVWNG